MEMKAYTAEETAQAGYRVGLCLEPGDVVGLYGEMGTGKTTFVQGLAKGLGVKRPVGSPTFPIICEYEGRVPLYHMDVYRLGENAWREALGFDEYFYGDGVCVVEWAEWLEPILPDERLDVYFRREANDVRTMIYVARGLRYQQLVRECAGQ
jgi:tRNA threonylcarbamoyladenosine biosynthesis protein TsaE